MVVYFTDEQLFFLQKTLDYLQSWEREGLLALGAIDNKLLSKCYSKIENALKQEKLLSLQRKMKAQKE